MDNFDTLEVNISTEDEITHNIESSDVYDSEDDIKLIHNSSLLFPVEELESFQLEEVTKLSSHIERYKDGINSRLNVILNEIEKEQTNLMFERKELEHDIEKFKYEKDNFHKEQELWETKLRTTIVDKNTEIIDLNVGGQLITVDQSTLCQVEGSLLAGIFSNINNLKKDKNGNIYLEFDGSHFELLVSYLRELRYNKSAKFPSVEGIGKETFISMCKHLEVYHENEYYEDIDYSEVLTNVVLESASQPIKIYGVGTIEEGVMLGSVNSKSSQDILVWRIHIDEIEGVKLFVGVIDIGWESDSALGWKLDGGIMKRADGKRKVGTYSGSLDMVLIINKPMQITEIITQSGRDSRTCNKTKEYRLCMYGSLDNVTIQFEGRMCTRKEE